METKKCIKKYEYGKNVVDLGEYVISLATFCNLGCEYCYLKFIKSGDSLLIQSNLEFLKYNLEKIFSLSETSFYFNLGETSDSLLTDAHLSLTEKFTEILSELAEKYKKDIFVEMRTKTTNIYKMKYLEFSEKLKIIYSISILPEEIKRNFEPNTSPVEERIKTLNYAEKINFLTGIRFEPVIIYPVFGISYRDIKDSIENLVLNYKNLIEFLREKINPEKLHSISISCLRLTKTQFKILKERKSKLCFPEMVICPDGKYRYSRPIRITIYRRIIEILKFYFGEEILSKIYLATEFPYIWKDCGLKIKKLKDFYQS